MMRALLRIAQGRWLSAPTTWIALGSPELPPRIRTDEGYNLESIRMKPETVAAYSRFKESVWRSFHGPWYSKSPVSDYRGFVEYSHAMAQRLLEKSDDYDIVYVNDFQQLLVGGLIGSTAPTMLRWHIPLDLRGYPEPVSRFFLKAMEGFDSVVVSTRTAMETLIRTDFHGQAFQLYPYVDPDEFPRVTPSDVRRFRETYDLGDSPIVLSVSRLDPVKRQDILVEAFAQVHRHLPKSKLVLVGGGSFSTRSLVPGGSRSKAEVWEEHLEALIRQRELERHVVLTGAISNLDLHAAYEAAEVFVHPTPWEGFGLVVVEAWTHGLPVIVSRGAGVAELVVDGVNGFTTRPGSVHQIAKRIRQLLVSPELRERAGRAGALGAARCHARQEAIRLRKILEDTIELYEKSGLRHPVPLGRPS